MNWLFGLLPAWHKKDLDLPRYTLEPSLHSSMDICRGIRVMGRKSEGMPVLDYRRQSAKLHMCRHRSWSCTTLQEISLKSQSPLIILHCNRYILYMKQVLSPWDSYFQSHPLALTMCMHLGPLTTFTELVSQREQWIFVTKLQPQDTEWEGAQPEKSPRSEHVCLSSPVLLLLYWPQLQTGPVLRKTLDMLLFFVLI